MFDGSTVAPAPAEVSVEFADEAWLVVADDSADALADAEEAAF